MGAAAPRKRRAARPTPARTHAGQPANAVARHPRRAAGNAGPRVPAAPPDQCTRRGTDPAPPNRLKHAHSNLLTHSPRATMFVSHLLRKAN
ncbi:hypothetical protein GCM10010377_27540 [Streptomyces viridiviolaceus]|nr:hypothetical protein GCM10010377_27540 [Streptomyces viridiviolaceus]